MHSSSKTVPIVVLHRRESKLPIEIPLQRSLKEELLPAYILRRFEGTTPMGRDIIRRQIYGFTKRLAEAGIKLRRAEPARF